MMFRAPPEPNLPIHRAPNDGSNTAVLDSSFSDRCCSTTLISGSLLSVGMFAGCTSDNQQESMSGRRSEITDLLQTFPKCKAASKFSRIRNGRGLHMDCQDTSKF